MHSKPLVRLWNLGRMRYLPALRLQEALANRIKYSPDETDVLLVVEHEPVYTTGIRTKEYSSAEERQLKSLGADFVRTNRGGLITFHGPGQLVAYPILNLKNFVPVAAKRKALLGMKWYIDKLEQVVIDTCGDFGLEGIRSPHTGVWIGDNKICAMGVRNSGFVTSHGLALNCDTDMKWFSHIVPCGIQGKGVTSLTQELERTVKLQEALPYLIDRFEKNFQCCVQETEEKEFNLES